MKHKVHAAHCIQNAVVVPHIAEVKLHRSVLEPAPHIILLLLIPAENPDLAKANLASHVDDGIAKGSRSTGDQKGLPNKCDWVPLFIPALFLLYNVQCRLTSPSLSRLVSLFLVPPPAAPTCFLLLSAAAHNWAQSEAERRFRSKARTGS